MSIQKQNEIQELLQKSHTWDEEANSSSIHPIHLRVSIPKAAETITKATLMIDYIVSGNENIKISERKKSFSELSQFIIIVNNTVKTYNLEKGKEFQEQHIEELLKVGDNLITVIPDKHCRIHIDVKAEYTVPQNFIF